MASSASLAERAERWKKIVIGSATVLGGGAAVIALFFELSDDKTRLDAFSVSRELSECGWSGEVVARRLLDGRSYVIKNKKLFIRGKGPSFQFAKQASIAFGIEDSALSLPQVGTFDPIIGYLRQMIGRPRKIITGEIIGKTEPADCSLTSFTITVRFPDGRVQTLSREQQPRPKEAPPDDVAPDYRFSRNIGCPKDPPFVKMGALLAELSDPLLLASYVWKCDHKQAMALVKPHVAKAGLEGLLARNIVGLIAMQQDKFEVASKWFRREFLPRELDAKGQPDVALASLNGQQNLSRQFKATRTLFLYNLAVAKKRRAQQVRDGKEPLEAGAHFGAAEAITDFAKSIGADTSQFYTVAGENMVEWSHLSTHLPRRQRETKTEHRIRKLQFKQEKLLRAISFYRSAIETKNDQQTPGRYYPIVQKAHAHLVLAQVEHDLMKLNGAEEPETELVQNHLEEAVKNATQAIKAEPLDGRPYTAFTTIAARICSNKRFQSRRDYCQTVRETQMAHLERSILIDPDYSRAYRMLAKLQLRTDEYKQAALKNFELSVDAFYNAKQDLNTVAIMDWSQALELLKRPEQAMKVLKRIPCERPDHPIRCEVSREKIHDIAFHKLRWNLDKLGNFMQCKGNEVHPVSLAAYKRNPQDEWPAVCN